VIQQATDDDVKTLGSKINKLHLNSGRVPKNQNACSVGCCNIRQKPPIPELELVHERHSRRSQLCFNKTTNI
jgi:hypothetical protein